MTETGNAGTKMFYVDAGDGGRVFDIIEYPHARYVPVELPMPLPDMVCGGIFQLVGGRLVYREEWGAEMNDDVT